MLTVMVLEHRAGENQRRHRSVETTAAQQQRANENCESTRASCETASSSPLEHLKHVESRHEAT